MALPTLVLNRSSALAGERMIARFIYLFILMEEYFRELWIIKYYILSRAGDLAALSFLPATLISRSGNAYHFLAMNDINSAPQPVQYFILIVYSFRCLIQLLLLCPSLSLSSTSTLCAEKINRKTQQQGNAAF